jgi:hypothetical protein
MKFKEETLSHGSGFPRWKGELAKFKARNLTVSMVV